MPSHGKVLRIKNRTENWKTARCLSPFFGAGAARLACKLGEPRSAPAATVKLELYWKGVRDWRARKTSKKGRQECDDRLVESCRRQYRNLKQDITQSGLFRKLGPGNYAVSSHDHRGQLITNLTNTEIDIVLESPGRLYIGEAKFLSSFDADGSLVLVHQLVRQYVMANVLLDVLGCSREVVPFVITEKPYFANSPRCPHQLKFMISQGWMDEAHFLTWKTLAKLTSGPADVSADT